MSEPQPRPELVERALLQELARDISVDGLRTTFALLTGWPDRRLPGVAALHEGVSILRDRDDVTVDVFVPEGAGPFPVLLYIHGGAWVAGNPSTHRRLTARFAQKGYLVVSVDYRLAPEHPFPAAFDDCVAALYWTAQHARRFGGDASRLAIGGDSAGGNLAAAVAIATRGRLWAPAIAAAVLIYGVFDFAKVGGKAFAPLMHEAYLGRRAPGALLVDPRVSPIHAAARLPPSHIVVGNEDPLLADSQTLHKALTDAAIEHEYSVVPNMPHGFAQMDFLPAARRSIDAMCAFLDRHTGASRHRRWRHILVRTLTPLISDYRALAP